MKNIILLLFAAILFISCSKHKDNSTEPPPLPSSIIKEVVGADQAQNRVIIADVNTQKIIWEWNPAASTDITSANAKWFVNMSDAKPVYNNKYILATASTGGVALVRIADKKSIFYAYAGNGNAHSAEVLPDGNIVVACSTQNYLIIFHTDTIHHPFAGYTKKVTLADAHNVVWDNKRQLLWSASVNKVYGYRYNFNCSNPDLALADSISLPVSGCHDLFSVYGKDSLWLSTSNQVWTVDLKKKTVTQASNQPRIKSVSSGPAGFPTIVLQSINTDPLWWSDNVIDLNDKLVFKYPGLEMYKARWLLPNTFSYLPNAAVTVCTQ